MRICVTNVETILAERGMTKKALAKNCGLSAQTISVTLLRGSCEPRTAGKIAKGLGVPVSDIVDQKEAV
jgi:DNA-binding XRE family transcriptional regulator